MKSVVGWFDRRFGIARSGSRQLNKVFPDHWSFMLGEIILYSFIMLILTGVYLTLFFEPSASMTQYSGSLPEYQGHEVSLAYDSALRLSFDVRFGLVVRQMHHWAALFFVAGMVVHMLRVFFTGAFRRPRETNWVIGCLLLILGIVNGFLGYSLLDDLLSGTGVRVGHSMVLGIPIVGTWLANFIFGGPFPDPIIIPRFFILHVLVLPGIILALVSAHLGLVWYQKHTQFPGPERTEKNPGPERTEKNVVGTRLYPVYLMKMVGLMCFVFGITALFGGLAQINPVWKYGPFHSEGVVAAVTSASQPDFYMGWLDGVLRLIPGWETRAFGFVIPNYFWGGMVLPGLIFGLMFAWPFIEPLWTKDRTSHNLLQRPREAPFRSAVGAAGLTFVAICLIAASNDVLSTLFRIPPEDITVFLRFAIIAVPIVVGAITWRICKDLQGTKVHPAGPTPHHDVKREADGGYTFDH